jgi:hypothetical protein
MVEGVQALVGSTLLTNLNLQSPSVLSATVPSGLALGTYDVKVINPSGASATLFQGYQVVDASGSSSSGTSASTKHGGCSTGGLDVDGLSLAAAMVLSLRRRRRPAARRPTVGS